MENNAYDKEHEIRDRFQPDWWRSCLHPWVGVPVALDQPANINWAPTRVGAHHC